MGLLHCGLIFICLSIAGAIPLKCDKIDCPEGSMFCYFQHSTNSAINYTTTEVTCKDPLGKITLKTSYKTDEKLLDIAVPEVVCGGHLCKYGAFSCLSRTDFSYSVNHSKEVTHLTCYNGQGNIIETRDIENPHPRPIDVKIPPPTCDGYTCPEGSLKCISNVFLEIKPTFNKQTNVTCYDINDKVLETKTF